MECRKMRYETKRNAETMRNEILNGKRKKGRPKDLRIYFCECGFWHLTRQVKEKSIELRQKRKRKDEEE